MKEHLGYDLKNGKLEMNEKEAEIVRYVFKAFEEYTSENPLSVLIQAARERWEAERESRIERLIRDTEDFPDKLKADIQAECERLRNENITDEEAKKLITDYMVKQLITDEVNELYGEKPNCKGRNRIKAYSNSLSPKQEMAGDRVVENEPVISQELFDEVSQMIQSQ